MNKLIENDLEKKTIETSHTNFQFEKRHLEQTLFYFENIFKNKSFKQYTKY